MVVDPHKVTGDKLKEHSRDMHSRPDAGRWISFRFFFAHPIDARGRSRGGGLPARTAYRNIYIGIGGDTTMPMMEDSSARSAMLIRDYLDE